jgi:uncharacterized protein (TIGR04255 family)
LANKRYEHDPIIEALCEFHFSADSSWDSATIGLVYEQLKNIFPTRREITVITANLDTATGEQVVDRTPRMQFFSGDEKSLVQISKDFLAINQLKPYTTWKQFLPMIEHGVNAYKNVVPSAKIERIGLRYINTITFPTSEITLEDYFNFYPHVVDGISKQRIGINMSVRSLYEDGRDILNTQLNTVGEATIALDFDYVLLKPEQFTLDNYTDWLQIAHNHVEVAFESCITDTAKKTFGEVIYEQ